MRVSVREVGGHLTGCLGEEAREMRGFLGADEAREAIVFAGRIGGSDFGGEDYEAV